MNKTSRSSSRSAILAVAALPLVLGACGDDSDDSDESSAGSPTSSAPAGPTYSTTAFVVPFDVTVPEWLPSDATTDESNFVTWEPGSPDDPPIRVLLPLNVYRPGDTKATPPPEDYLAYLLSQSEQGATFTDTSETTVDGNPATLVTATVTDSLEGSLGCYVEDQAAGDCFGLQPDLALRIAVVDVSDSTLLIWLRHSGAGDTEDATQDFEAFEQMLETVTFRDEAPPTTETTTGAVSSTAIDGTWTTSFTREELADSPLLFDSDEVNDDNWGDFTLTFRNGAFTLEGTNPKASSSISGSFDVDDDVVRLSLEGGDEFVMRYSVEGDVLAFERDESLGVAPTPLVLQPWNREA